MLFFLIKTVVFFLFESPAELANFLYNAQNISKNKLGEYFGEEPTFNLDVYFFFLITLSYILIIYNFLSSGIIRIYM